jgi:CRISP-associated protein Cas1
MAIIQHLIVEEFGMFVGKHSERLIVTRGEDKIAQAPLMHLESVTIASGGVALSADAIRECAERGIPIYFVSKSGTPYASVYSSGLAATVITRREQMQAYSDGPSGRGAHIAIALTRGKLRNQANLLKYVGKYRKESAPNIYEELQLCAHEVIDRGARSQQILGRI